MNSGQKKPPSKQDKREAILQAAWKLIRHYGYNKTTVEDIAQSAGVGKGTVYLHFRSKAEIMLALTDLTNKRIARDLDQIAAKDTPPADRLRACLLHRIMTLFDIVHRYPHSEDVIASLLPDIVQRLDGYVRRHGELLGEILRQGTESGDLAVPDPDETGQLLAGMFELLTPPHYRFRSRKALEQFANATFDLLLVGLRKGSR
ncbi:MAG: TetR/AcrR family transcriptional regulator [Deltaproteobacteria bacterium]|nr:TetR/AcrR family transcriptional regulator [Deltaproteobacteria bacterium]